MTSDAFLQKTPVATKRVIFLGMLFVSFLIMSNLTGIKISEVHVTENFSFEFPSALIFFPLTYIFDDILTEVYGFKISRLIIWCGLLCGAIVTICTWIVVKLPVSPAWDASTNHGNSAYEMVFTGSSRMFVASLISYFISEFVNSMILAKLKVLTGGKYFSLRALSSTAIGVGIDSVIFFHIAFLNILPIEALWKMIFIQYVFKISYEIIMLPVTYALVNYLKKKDNIDYYDTNTNFNPFSLTI